MDSTVFSMCASVVITTAQGAGNKQTDIGANWKQCEIPNGDTALCRISKNTKKLTLIGIYQEHVYIQTPFLLA